MNTNDNDISRRLFLAMAAKGTAATVLLGVTGHVVFNDKAYAMANISYSKLPRWRGFNLVEKVTLERNRAYEEWDFDVIKAWGFDFVRLPLDYRIWTKKVGDYDEKPLKEIDQAIKWARERGIHVNLCLHRAPGYCVNPPKEALNLWADGQEGNEARGQFAAQWSMLAERYRGIPSSALSFNLVNEPPKLKKFQYLYVASSGIEAIRKKDADRLVIADGIAGGSLPATELASLKIAQSLHGYGPMELTHYKASWLKGAEKWPIPSWPLMASLNQYLYGDWKPEFKSSLILKGKFSEGARLSVNVQTVSAQAQLQIRANGTIIKEYGFKPDAGHGEWKESTFNPDGSYYKATYDKAYSVTLPRDVSEIEILVGKGDWLTFSEIRVDAFPGVQNNVLVLTPTNTEYGQRQRTYLVDSTGKIKTEGSPVSDKEILWKVETMLWKNLEALGVGIHVGEWGAHRFTPHDVVLSWMNDRLNIWKQAGWGWALWNLRGQFGPLDSERTDVSYENYKGHKLDRKMLELLRQG